MAREGEGQIVAHPKQLPKIDTLARNAAALAPLVPDAWTNLSFGVAVLAAQGSAPLARVGPTLLASSSPAASFAVRMVLHANQTGDAAAWQSQLEARVAAGDPPLAQHEAW